MFTGILALIVKLMGSSGFGAVIGAIGGFANRWMDLKFRVQEIALEEKRMDHQLKLREADRETIKVEWEARSKVASIEGEAKIESAAYGTIAESYRHDMELMKGAPKWVVALQGAVRPVLTAVLIIACLVNVALIWYWAFEINETPMTADQVFGLFEYTIMWSLFQGSVVIGWYFATRPGVMPSMRSTTRGS